MNKKKKEQIIVLVLVPLFLLSLIYARTKGGGLGKKAPGKTIFIEKEDKEITKIAAPQGILDIQYKAGKRDPLKNLFKAYIYELNKKASEGGTENLPLPELEIEGLIWNTDMPQAIVNGSVVKIGDTIEGVEVLKIERGGLTIKYAGQEVFVPKM